MGSRTDRLKRRTDRVIEEKVGALYPFLSASLTSCDVPSCCAPPKYCDDPQCSTSSTSCDVAFCATSSTSCDVPRCSTSSTSCEGSDCSTSSTSCDVSRCSASPASYDGPRCSASVFSCSSFMVCVLLFLAPVLQNQGTVSASGDDRVNITKILNAFFEKGYDRRVRPNYGGPPVMVSITMFILSISSVSEVRMDFTLDFYFRQAWTDDRLTFTPRTGFESLTVGAEVADRIWVPDTFFVNEKSAYFHQATTHNTFLRISAGGEVLRSIRLTVTAGCPMDLQYFPMDRQMCFLEIESFGYTMRDIRYQWGRGENSIGMSTDVELPQFKVLGHRQDQKEEHLSTGNYSRLVCEIQFVRSMGYYLIQIYIPAGLIVIISWVSFWLHRNATPARVALGVTTVLTMTTLMSNTNSALPKISYVKSIDVYLGTCFVMVFASLLEYATVGYLGKRISLRKARNQKMAKMAQEHRQRCVAAAAAAEGAERCAPPPEAVLLPGHAEVTMVKSAVRGQPEGRQKLIEGRHPSKPAENPANGAPDLDALLGKKADTLFGVCPSDIDKYSRVVFPVFFVCFNLMYWIIYLHISDTINEDFVSLGSR